MALKFIGKHKEGFDLFETVGGETVYSFRVRDRSTGKHIRRNFRRIEDARAARDEMRKGTRDRTWVDPAKGDIRLGAWLLEVDKIGDRKGNAFSASTLRNHGLADKHLAAFGIDRLRLRDITKHDADAFRAYLRDNVKPAAANKAIDRAKAGAYAAMRKELIPANPFAHLERFEEANADEEVEPLTLEQVRAILDHVPERFRVPTRLLFFAGLRIGELAFLQVQHFDRKTRVLRIEGTASDVGGHIVRGTTKTKKGKRRITLSPAMSDAVWEHIQRYSNAFDDEALIFTSPEGKQLRTTMFRQRIWRPACKAAGIDPIPPVHTARHTAASLMIATGATMKVVQKTLGHADIAVTGNTYAHMFDDQAEQLADDVEAMLGIEEGS